MPKGCADCNYSGYTLVEENGYTVIKNCKCLDSLSYERLLEKANIPRRYWEFGVSGIDKAHIELNAKSFETVNTYIGNLDYNTKRGKGFWVVSNPGLGKSTILCEVLKTAVSQNKKVYYIKASKIIDMKYAALRDRQVSSLVDYITDDVDILAIDEFDKVYLPEASTNQEEPGQVYATASMTRMLFFNFLSDVYDSRKSLIISSNRSRKKTIEKYNTDILDRLRELPLIKLIGQSARQKG